MAGIRISSSESGEGERPNPLPLDAIFPGLKEAKDADYETFGIKRKAHEEDDNDEIPNSDSDSESESEEPKQKKKKKQEEEKQPEKKTRVLSAWREMFEPRDTTAGQLFVLCGKSERGKTHFMRWMLYTGCARKRAPFQFGLIFVRTKYRNAYKFHKKSKPYVKMYQGFLPSVLIKWLEKLEERFEKNGYVEPSFIVFEDLFGVLENNSPWFNNFMATFRHLNITIFVAVQTLMGKNAISPIMRDQTTAAIMFNTKTERSITNLYENYGMLFANKKAFQHHLQKMTEPESTGSPFSCCIYFEREDRLSHNYMSWLAPKKLPDGQVRLLGPDPPGYKKFKKQTEKENKEQKVPGYSTMLGKGKSGEYDGDPLGTNQQTVNGRDFRNDFEAGLIKDDYQKHLKSIQTDGGPNIQIPTEYPTPAQAAPPTRHIPQYPSPPGAPAMSIQDYLDAGMLPDQAIFDQMSGGRHLRNNTPIHGPRDGLGMLPARNLQLEQSPSEFGWPLRPNPGPFESPQFFRQG